MRQLRELSSLNTGMYPGVGVQTVRVIYPGIGVQTVRGIYPGVGVQTVKGIYPGVGVQTVRGIYPRAMRQIYVTPELADGCRGKI